MNPFKLAGLALVLLHSPLSAGDFPPGLREFLEGHYRVLDPSKARANLHSKGKSLERLMMVGSHCFTFPLPRFKYELKQAAYIGTDGEFHYVRHRHWLLFDGKLRKQVNRDADEVDGITLYKREDGQWKIYDEYTFSRTALPVKKAGQ